MDNKFNFMGKLVLAPINGKIIEGVGVGFDRESDKILISIPKQELEDIFSCTEFPGLTLEEQIKDEDNMFIIPAALEADKEFMCFTWIKKDWLVEVEKDEVGVFFNKLLDSIYNQ